MELAWRDVWQEHSRQKGQQVQRPLGEGIGGRWRGLSWLYWKEILPMCLEHSDSRSLRVLMI